MEIAPGPEPSSELNRADQPPENKETRKKNKTFLEHPVVLYGLIGGIAFIVLLIFAIHSGLDTPFIPGNDPSQYTDIAASIAHGGGYRDPSGLWPAEPAYDRMPVWPLILSVPMMIAPYARDEVISRLTNIILLALAGVAMGALCRRLGVRPLLCLLSGLYLSLSPILIFLAIIGMSEISFIFIVSTGLVLAFSGRRYLYPAAILIGLGPLVRPNFVVVPVLFAALALLVPSVRRTLSATTVKRAALALCLAMLPTAVWLTRNYSVTGRFPFMTSIFGETFYGSNNDETAYKWTYWGSWVIPDFIPGETPKKVLAKRLPSDLALNDYYTQRGKEWIKSHLAQMPFLVLGKLFRSFVPMPRSDQPALEEYVAAAARFVLQLLVLITIPIWWRGMNREYLLFLAALLISHLISTVILHGEIRYTFCFLEVFAIPCAAFGVDHWLDRFRRHSVESISPTRFAGDVLAGTGAN
jgi:hypothetical protein